MTPVLVDTDVVSMLFKGDTRAELYDQHLTGRQLVISFMTLAELERWPLERNWGQVRQETLKRYLRQFGVYFADGALCRKWAEVVVGAQRKGRPIMATDAWIAATALLHGLPLVTHNRRHYDQIDGLQVISETPP